MLVKKNPNKPNNRWKKCKYIQTSLNLVYAIYLDFNDPNIRDNLKYTKTVSKLIVKNFDKTNIDHVMTYWAFCPTYRPEFVIESEEAYEKLIKNNSSLIPFVIPYCKTTGPTLRLMNKLKIYNFTLIFEDGHVPLKYDEDLSAIFDIVNEGDLNIINNPFVLKNYDMKFMSEFAIIVCHIKEKTGKTLLYSETNLSNKYILDWAFMPQIRLDVIRDLTNGVLSQVIIKFKTEISESFLTDVFKLNLDNLVEFYKNYRFVNSYYEAFANISSCFSTVVTTVTGIYSYLLHKGVINKINKHLAHKKCKKLYAFDKEIEKMLPYLSINAFTKYSNAELLKKLNIE
jgi:hypothetical protein